MKLQYLRKVSENRDFWERCQFSSLRKGDIFYTLDGETEGPFLAAISDVQLRPSPTEYSKLIWHIKIETLSDDNFL